MDYIKPLDVAKAMVSAGTHKANLSLKDLLLRGFLSGAILAFATSFAITAAAQTNAPIVGALVFPAGFVMINWMVCLGRLEKGRFQIPRVAPGATRAVLDTTEPTMLLDGIDLSRVKRPELWEPKRPSDDNM